MSLIGLLNYFDQKRGQEQYAGLLNEYRVAPDPEARPIGNTAAELDQNIARMQGGFRGEGGLISGGPPQEFYMRAAALPGYQGLVQQALVGQQAMERQVANQQWQENNMTAGQRAQLEVQQEQQKWERERRVFEWNNPSAVQQAAIAAQKAQIGISAGHLGLAQKEFELKRKQADAVARFPALGLTGQAAMDYQAGLGKLDRAAQIGTDVAQYLSTIPVGGKALDRGTVNAMQSAYEQHVVPALATMVGTGTIQQGDMDFIKSVIGNPGSWASLDANQRQKVVQVLASINDERTRLYGLGGMRPPEVRPGSSAWARSRGSVEPPRDVTFQTIGGP